MKAVFYVEPQVGGTYTFFEQLRAGLARRGVELVCVPPVSGEKFAGTRFAGRAGVDYVRFPDGLPEATRVLCDHAARGGFDIAMNLPGCDILTTNLFRYLPRPIRTVANIPMMTEGAYRPARAIAGRLDRVCCVSDRIAQDLAASLPRELLTVIYNCCDTSLFAPPPAPRPAGPLRLVYAGRLEDTLKNVLMLPRILARVRAALPDATMEIVGHGVDGDRLRRSIAQMGLDGCCTLTGAVANHEVADCYGRADLLVMPSRSEGSPIAMMEAMACGCPPVITRLRGSTDVIVEDGVSGCLCRVEDVEDFAERIVELGRDRARLDRMRGAAVERIRGGYTAEHLAENYRRVFEEVLASPDRRDAPAPPDRYEIPRPLRPTWRRFLPAPVKTFIRSRLERLGIST